MNDQRRDEGASMKVEELPLFSLTDLFENTDKVWANSNEVSESNYNSWYVVIEIT